MRQIPIARPLIEEEDINAVVEVLKSGMLAHGKEVEAFEREFAQYVGTSYGVAVVNGTMALDVALKALNIKPGDEVITTPFTFIASSNSILFQGAKPVFCDIDEKTFNLNPDEVLEKISNKTKAILVVHLYGQPADMEAFKEIAQDYNLYLIEDCAQAHGAEFKGQKVGTFGDIATFSFYPTKNMTTGEGG
ncbi:MAG TPA: DegT/DnrJ/EryC1/StrS family aminotransferase, partial [Pyrodictiaceae archaeon]|nr:DegT/DnrJ/EryC1/StrS family aminotransferase [Pyrodictiaceae archaeon]